MRNAFWFQSIVESHIDFYYTHAWNEFRVNQTKKSVKTRQRWKITQQSAFIHYVVDVKHRWTNENFRSFYSIKHSQNHRCNYIVNETCVEVEITLKSKMRRRRVDDATQAKSSISIAHKADMTKISQDNERKEKNNCTRKKNRVSSSL